MLEQLRANWIAAPERTMLVDALHGQMTRRLAAVLPHDLVSSLAAELATAAIAEVDAIVAKPVQAHAHTITIKDHRG